MPTYSTIILMFQPSICIYETWLLLVISDVVMTTEFMLAYRVVAVRGKSTPIPFFIDSIEGISR
ncbi:hypothetical protein EB232_03920 [Mesorhizobium sp. NZP2077]|nr:hypothetical protein EB232_03920 [Mesorhizobium sp. NZP2077]